MPKLIVFLNKCDMVDDAELLELVAHMSDDDIWRLQRGGHDYRKVYAAFKRATEHKGQPTVILAKTKKGYGMGGAALNTRIDEVSEMLAMDDILERRSKGFSQGQRIKVAGQGEAGLRGAPSGDLYVTIHVSADKVFGRAGDDLTLVLPVSYAELVLGTTVSVPTLDGRVGVKVPAGTADGRVLRVRGRGVPRRAGGAGDLLVTVKVAVPQKLDDNATDALKAYVEAEKASGFEPRAGWAGA